MKLLARLLVALALICCASPAAAQLTVRGVGGGGFGGASVVLNGVLVTQEYSPTLGSTVLSNSPTFVESFWFRCSNGTVASVGADPFQSCNNAILAGNFADVTCGGSTDAEHTPGLNVVNESPAAGGTFRFNINNATCGANNSALGSYTGTNVLDGNWHHLLLYGDVTKASATAVRAGGVYLDGVQIVAGFTDQGVLWATGQTVAFTTNPFYLNATNKSASTGQDARKFEIAQFYLDLNAAASPVTGSTNTPSFSVASFYSGGPVDFGTNCTTPLGHQPTACFPNSAATFNTNVGTLGTNFSVTQFRSNTITGIPYAAAVNPGETADRPWVRWSYTTQWNSTCSHTTQTCSPVRLNVGNPILQGDLICAFINVSLATGSTNQAFSMAGSGYTTVIATLVGNSENHFTACKTAGVGDVTSPGGDWTSPTWTWTDGGVVFSLASTTIVDFGKYGAGGTTPTVNTSGAASAASGSLPYPTLTSPSGNSLWFGSTTTYDWGFITASAGPAATGTLVGKLPRTASGNGPMMVVEKLGSSASIARTAQESGALGNPTIASVLILN